MLARDFLLDRDDRVSGGYPFLRRIARGPKALDPHHPVRLLLIDTFGSYHLAAGVLGITVTAVRKLARGRARLAPWHRNRIEAYANRKRRRANEDFRRDVADLRRRYDAHVAILADIPARLKLIP